MKSASLKSFGTILFSVSLLSGCMTAAHLKEPITPRDTPAFDLQGTSIPTFNPQTAKPQNGYQKLLPYLPYVLPVQSKFASHPLDTVKFSTYVTENAQPNALLYDDVFESMLVTYATKSSKTTTTAQLASKSAKTFEMAVAKLSTKYKVESVLTRGGYNTNKFSGASQPYVSKRYIVTSDKAIKSSDIRDDLLTALYKRPTNPQTGTETLVKNRAFYVDLTTWSDVQAISNIHISAWVHPLATNRKTDEDEWIDARADYINANAFIHFEK